MIRYCNCEDFPCCGHVDADGRSSIHPDLRQYCTGPEDAEEWFDGLDPEEQEWVESHMSQCNSCGEWTNRKNLQCGICNACQDMPEREGSVTAGKNTGKMLAEKDREIEDLQAQITALQEQVRARKLPDPIS